MANQLFYFLLAHSYRIVLTLNILFWILLPMVTHSQSSTDDHIKNGIAKAIQKDYKGAILEFSKEIKLHPDNFKTYLYRAYAKEGLLDYKGAIQDYDKAIQLKPDNAEAHNERALANYTSGDLKNACADWKKSIELGLPDAAYLIKQYCK